MAVDRTAYLSWELSDLQLELDKVQAEVDRQRTAGGSFGLPGGRNRAGVPYEILLEELGAFRWAIAYKDQRIVTDTIGDCSRDPS